jgi:hypothetical protein
VRWVRVVGMSWPLGHRRCPLGAWHCPPVIETVSSSRAMDTSQLPARYGDGLVGAL